MPLPFVPKPAPSPERQAAAVARVERALERAPWDHPLKVEGLLTAAEAAAETEATEAVAAALASLPFEVIAAIEPPAKRERLCLRFGHLAAAAGQCELSRRALSAAGEAAEDLAKIARARRVA